MRERSFPFAGRRPTLPAVRPASRPDVRLTVLASFAAGFLLGIPLTFAALFLFAAPETSAAISPDPSTYEHSSSANGIVESEQTAERQRSVADSAALVSGVFWTPLAESYVPEGFGDASARRWRDFLNATEVLRLEPGCGRMQNRLLTLADGSRACARYRRNDDQMQGEIFSFRLGRLLGLPNLAPSALVPVEPRSRRWSSAAPQVALAGWRPGRPAVLTQFVEGLRPAFLPAHLRDSKSMRLHPVAEELRNLSAAEISELVQWSDLLVFDYLTANLDRAVNNLFNERWNAAALSQPAHNLHRAPGGLLLFLDNESGLVHGYRLLRKYEPLHAALLRALCLFRPRTVQRMRELMRREGALERGLRGSDALDPLPFLPEGSLSTLRERMRTVEEQVRRCEERFPPS